MGHCEALLRSTLVGTIFVFCCYILGVSGADSGEGSRNRPSKVAVNGSHRYRVADFDFSHVETPYVISLWILLASVAKIGFHLYNKLSSIFPESCLLIVMGVVVGVILYFSRAATAEKYTLSPNTFFLFLLPPIVLDAGYFMPSRAFFDNIGTILLYAVVGTLFNTVTIGTALYGVSAAGWIGVEISLLHCLVFSSLISAVDPVAVLAVFEEIHVNEMLYIIVFGESLLNDAVTVVLYHMMETYSEIGEDYIQAVDLVSGVSSFFVVGICGTLIGVVFGFLCGFITKYTDHVRVIEPLFVFVLAYLSYLTSEMLHLSGILAIVFCGIVMKQYVEANVSQKSHTTIKYFMKMLSNISETIIFMFLGLSTVVDNHDWNVPFILFTVLFTLVFRAVGVIILTWFANRIRLCRLSKVDQFVMSYGGLRGAIALGLVLLLNEEIVQEKRMMVTACIVVVFFTVFVQGITIKPLVNFLKVKKADKRMPSMNEQINERLFDHVMAGIEDVAGHYGHHYLRDKYELFNNKYLKPLLMRDKPKTRETKIFHVFTKLNMKEAMDHLAEHGSFNILDMAKEPSLAKIIRNYSNHSLNENGGDSVPAAHAEEIEKTDTVLDMAAVEAKYSKKMADDSKIHHILDDAMFVARRRFSSTQKHVIPDLHNHPPFKHNIRKEIRRLASIGKQRAKTTKSLPRSDVTADRDTDYLKQHKYVSFSHSAPPNKDKRHVRLPDTESLNEDDDVGIIFTARRTSMEQDPQDSPDGLGPSGVDKTAVEIELPWRRLTSRDECPNLSEAPSWANNLAYHGLTETGSPYTSPQQTIQREGETTPPTIFTIFPRVKNEDTDSALAMSVECLNICPATGEPTNHECVTTHVTANGIHAGSRRDGSPVLSSEVHKRHRDSGVIDDSSPDSSTLGRERASSANSDSTTHVTLTPDTADTTEETKL